MDVRRFGAHYRSPAVHAQAHARGLRDLLRHRVPRPRAAGGPAAAHVERLPVARRARRRVRREERLGARQLLRVQRRGRRRVAAPARLGRQALVARDRRRAPRPAARRRRCSTSRRSPSSRSPGRAPPSCSSGCATTASRATSGRSPTRRCSTRAAGSSATSRSRRVEDELFQVVTGTAFGQHDRAWIARHAPRDGSVRLTDTTARWACFALWGPRARDDPRAADAPTRWTSATCGCASCAVGDVPVRALRVTFVGELGWELYCPTEYGAGAVAHAVGGGARRTGCSPAATRRSTRCAWRRATACGARTSRPTTRRTRRGWASRVRDDKDVRRARRARARAACRGACAASCSTTRARWRWATSRCASAGDVAGRVTSGGYGYTVARSIAYAYLPPEHDVGTAVEVDIFGRWVAGAVAAEPLYDPRGERLRS